MNDCTMETDNLDAYIHVHVIPVQLMRPDIGRNVSCTFAEQLDLVLFLMEMWLIHYSSYDTWPAT